MCIRDSPSKDNSKDPKSPKEKVPVRELQSEIPSIIDKNFQYKNPEDLNLKIRKINRDNMTEQKQRRQAKNHANNMIRTLSKKNYSSTSLTPRFAPKKLKNIEGDTGLNDIYSWTNNASCLKIINHGHHLAKGNFSGKAEICSVGKGESKSLCQHPSKILSLHYDFQHHLCLSVSANLLQIQRENSQGYTSIRKLRLKNFPEDGPSLVKLSVSLNMIIFVSACNQIFIIDYEFLKMFARVYVPCISLPSERSKNKVESEKNICNLNLK